MRAAAAFYAYPGHPVLMLAKRRGQGSTAVVPTDRGSDLITLFVTRRMPMPTAVSVVELDSSSGPVSQKTAGVLAA